ncbi:YlbF family regulator [Sulfuriroseicoccus oceanibius]|uniref:YlbF family regulator n=1 Tax=Sulfuriroseicoccus oceanibius TaxID=2707525 RepID=A0A6B3L773_9BACT|nr:YlbF family regulator [Sulfuriroseicoccus oceanibius]QQL43905.1 YlbF family regulator [Sulfuriroseicoccus oceanibius]
MNTTTDSPAIISKIKELCRELVNDDAVQKHSSQIDAFLGNDEAKAAYEEVSALGGQLQALQQSGQELKEEEIKSFEEKREALFQNEVVTAFLESQKALQDIHATVGTWVGKTLELGEVPSEADIAEAQGGGCCGGNDGGGCGCA